MDPTYTEEDIARLGKAPETVRALDGQQYTPGIVGLNDIKENTTINVVLQSLMRVPRLRNFFLRGAGYERCHSDLVDSFGRLMRRVWSRGLFKAQISPHEMLQAISTDSKKHFRSGHVGILSHHTLTVAILSHASSTHAHMFSLIYTHALSLSSISAYLVSDHA